MNEDQLRQFIERQEYKAQRTDVAHEQAQAMDYYLRRPFGNEESGRSQVISSDVWDVVEGMAPIVLKPFVSSSDVVQFSPVGPEDEEAAKQETDYLNYVVTQRNDAFVQFLAWAKCGLLQKNGIVKYWWEKTRRVRVETYYGQTDDVYNAILQDKELDILEHTAEIDPETSEPVHDVKVRYHENDGYARYEVVPPEEFRIIGRDPNPQNSSFVQHITRQTLSDLREMGYEVDDDVSSESAGDPTSDPQAQARNRAKDWQDTMASDGDGDPAMREVWLRETYCRVDYDGDGIAELRKVCMVGTKVLANEECEEIPFSAWTPYQQLFQFDGRCPADETIEIQDVKSTLWRQMLDNIYTINNNRVFAGKHVNLDDLLDNQIAGIVRVNSDIVGNQVQSLPITPLGQVIQPAIEYVDAAKENRTGFTRYNQGNDADSLNKTATGIRIISQAGTERLGLIQRSLAEQGMKPLMLGLHGLCRRHATKEETIRLRGKWVTIDPRSWKQRYDMSVSVGLGTMDKTMEMQTQAEIIKMQTGAGLPAGCATPENIYNAMAKYAELTGEKNPDKYFTHPSKVQSPPPPDPAQNPEFMLEVKKAEQGDRKLDLEERQISQHDRELDQQDAKLGIEGQNAQVDALMRHTQLMMENERHDREMALPHQQELAAGQQAMQAQQQEHSQGMDVQKQSLAEQQAEEAAKQARQANGASA